MQLIKGVTQQWAVSYDKVGDVNIYICDYNNNKQSFDIK